MTPDLPTDMVEAAALRDGLVARAWVPDGDPVESALRLIDARGALIDEMSKGLDDARAEVARLTQERDAARDEIFTLQNSDSLAVVQAEAERNRALTVVRAAEEWVDNVSRWGGPLRKVPGNIAGASDLIAAVDAYREGGETP